LARLTGETKLIAIRRALEERLARLAGPSKDPKLIAALLAIGRRASRRPIVDPEFTEDSLYDEHGVPTTTRTP
jgi:hypothetical protein